MEENKSTSWKEIFKIFVFSIGIFALIFLCAECGNKNKHKSTSDIYIDCYLYSQELVKQELKSPKSAEFPTYSKSFITDKGNTILVSSFVDADNSFGTTNRVYYTATIKLEKNEPISGTATLIE